MSSKIKKNSALQKTPFLTISPLAPALALLGAGCITIPQLPVQNFFHDYR
jgi:hypothetical protein